MEDYNAEKDLLLPAILIRDAESGKFIKFNTHDDRCVRSYAIYTNRVFTFFMKICIGTLLLLVLFEEPAMDALALPMWGTLAIEWFCLLFLCFRLFHRQQFSVYSSLKTDARFIAAWVIIAFTAFDIIFNLAWMQFSPVPSLPQLPRFTRVLRPILIICFPIGSEMFRIFRNIRRSLPDVLALLAILTFGISFFAIMVEKIFGPRNLVNSDGSPFMPNFFDAWWELYILMTTANNPDVMLPAYDYSSVRALVFILFLMMVMYVFMNITLATLYNNYKENLKEDVQLLVYRKRARLSRAFDLLKQWHPKLECDVVTQDTWRRLMKFMKPKIDDLKIKVYLLVLTDGEIFIKKHDFLLVADLLSEPIVSVDESPICCERTCTTCYRSGLSQRIRKTVMSPWFRYTVDMIIVGNTVTIAISYHKFEAVFLTIFTVELILKLYTFGAVKFLSSAWNWLDFFIIVAAIVATIALEAAGAGRNADFNFVETILVLRLLRLLRLLGVVSRFRIIFRTVVKTLPSLVSYTFVLMVIYYIFGIIGMEIFKYKITYHGYGDNLSNQTMYCGNPLLKNAEFAIKRYCKINFNHFPSTVVVLFTLMVVNQWHVIAQGYEFVTTKAARLYFLSFHVIVVIILMNIFTGIVLEVYMLEYSVKDQVTDPMVERKIKNLGLGVEEPEDFEDTSGTDKSDTELLVGARRQVVQRMGLEGVKFQLKASGGRATMKMLQAMFEGELDADEEGSELPHTGELTEKEKLKIKLLRRAQIDS